MKLLAKLTVSIVSIAMLLGIAAPAFAAYPYLTVTREGGQGNVRMVVQGADPYAQITLNRRQGTQLWTVISNFGQTDGSGYFTTISSLGSDSSSNVVDQYVTVGGQSSSVVQTYPYDNGGCGYNCGSSFTLGQTNLTLTSGQSSSISLSGNTNNAYVSTNSNSNVASASLSGNLLTVYGNVAGSTTISVCGSYSGQCLSLYVTVNGSFASTLSLSQTSATLNVGQTSTISVYNTSSLYVSSNSNSSVVSASVSGNILSLYGLQNGTSSVVVCSNNYSCGTAFVTVNNQGNNYGTVWFSPSSLNLNYNQTSSVTAYSSNYGGNYYLSSNSNPGVVSANVVGNTINVTAVASGTTSFSICQTNGNTCGYVSVTVTGFSYGNGNSLSFNTPTLPLGTVGQYYSYQIPVSGGVAPYNFSILSGQLPNGLTLSGNGLLYGTLRYGTNSYFSLRVTDNYGRSATANFTINSTSGSVLGASTNLNGQLISQNGTVYIVYKNIYTGFGSRSAFEGLGYNFGQIVYSNTIVQNSGYIVRSANSSHPWGSWIKSGGTIYFVHEFGLIPVPDYNTFISNGGQDYLVVKANSYDFRLSQLSNMVTNDARIR